MVVVVVNAPENDEKQAIECKNARSGNIDCDPGIQLDTRNRDDENDDLDSPPGLHHA